MRVGICKPFWLFCLAGAMLGLAAPVAWAGFPPASLPALETAKQDVAKGDWGGALDAYTEHLSKLTTRDYRDKKTYTWILDAYEKAAPDGKPDYEAFKKLVRERLPRYKRRSNPVSTWRLHLLLATTARREGDESEAQKELSLAILTYPNITYPEPDVQSRLQHLYNQVALARAKVDVKDGEDYLIDSFLRDERFEYVYLKPWKAFYAAAGTPKRYQALVKRVIDACKQKAQRFPTQADTLVHYRRQYAQELKGKKP